MYLKFYFAHIIIMKKVNYLVVFILLISSIAGSTVEAAHVNLSQALQVAQASMQNGQTLRSGAALNLELVYTATSSKDSKLKSAGEESVYYYVFNDKDGSGYVIVAGDDVCTPIIGYSKTGTYDKDNLPPSFAAWMDGVCQSIDYALENNLEASAKTQEKWQTYLQGNATMATIVAPLIQTKWNQGSPYNSECPQNRSGEYTLTGCVATAMAQLMYYHKCPQQQGVGYMPSYRTDLNYTVPAINFATSQYNWNDMTLTYHAGSSEASKKAVATLMLHCGASAWTDYGTSGQNGSSATMWDAAVALRDNFRYDASIKIEDRAYYETEEWKNIIKRELDNRRPIFYSGLNSRRGGHAFIIDGYNSADYFHFNWGWGGYNDDYFAIDGQEYNVENEMTVNIAPNHGGEPHYSFALHPRSDLCSDTAHVNRGDLLKVSGVIHNIGIADYTNILTIGFALVDDNDAVVEVLFSYIDNEGLLANQLYNIENLPCEVRTAPDGYYNLRAFIKTEGSNTYQLLKGAVNRIDEIQITVGDPTSLPVSPPAEESIVIYPNPMKDQFRISNSGVGIQRIKLVDMQGRTLKEIIPDTTEMDIPVQVSDMPTGVYGVILQTTDGSIIRKKIIKN